MADKKAKFPKITLRVTCYTEQLSRDLNSGKVFLFRFLRVWCRPGKQIVFRIKFSGTQIWGYCVAKLVMFPKTTRKQEKLCCCLLVEQIYIKNEKKFVDFVLLFISKLIWEQKVFSLFHAIFYATVKQNHHRFRNPRRWQFSCVRVGIESKAFICEITSFQFGIFIALRWVVKPGKHSSYRLVPRTQCLAFAFTLSRPSSIVMNPAKSFPTCAQVEGESGGWINWLRCVFISHYRFNPIFYHSWIMD